VLTGEPLSTPVPLSCETQTANQYLAPISNLNTNRVQTTKQSLTVTVRASPLIGDKSQYGQVKYPNHSKGIIWLKSQT